MAISLVTGGNLAAAVANGGNPSINLPLLLQNEVVIACVGGPFRSGWTPGPSTAGYTQLAILNTSGAAIWIGYKVMGVVPDTTFVGLGSGNTQDSTGAAVFCLHEVSTAIVEATTVTAGPTTSTNPDAPAIVTVNANAWVLAFAVSVVNDSAITAPSGYVNAVAANVNDTNPTTIGAATLTKVSPGSENPPSWTAWSSGVWVAATVAIKPLALTAAISESLTLAESPATTAAFVSSDSEALTLAESPATTAAFVSSDSEALTLAESSTGGVVFSDSISEALTLAEASSAVATFTSAISEALTLAESSAAVAVFISTISEAATLAEAASATAAFVCDLVEVAALTDAQDSVAAFIAELSEAATLGEVADALAQFVSDISETINVTETTTGAATFIEDQMDTLALDASEDSALTPGGPAIVESITLSESSDAAIPQVAAITEALSLGDSSRAQKTRHYGIRITGTGLRFSLPWRLIGRKGSPRFGVERYVSLSGNPILFQAPALGVASLLLPVFSAPQSAAPLPEKEATQPNYSSLPAGKTERAQSSEPVVRKPTTAELDQVLPSFTPPQASRDF